MKIIYFNFKEVEKNAIKQWQKANPDVELTILENEFGQASIDLIKDHDGICISQITPAGQKAYEALKNSNVKVFSTRSAGVDMYDRKALDALSIKLTNVPSYSPNAIAEHVLATTLQISRNFKKIQRNLERFNFSWNKGIVSRELRTLTVGIVGTGRIGTQTAKLFSALGAKVIGYDICQNEEAKKYLTYVDSLDQIAENSDVVSLHVPGIKEYDHVINADFINKMPDNAILINAARGNLVDTKAVLNALDSGKLLGAGLDVYEHEAGYIPKDLSTQKDIEDDLLKTLIARDDVIYTPHTAFYTFTAIENLVQGALTSAKNVIKNGDDGNIVNFK